jgi:predicted phage terminase large subunit-like protein
LRTLRMQHDAYFKIEKAGYQLALIQQAVNEGIPCKEYQPVKDKVSRASTASVWMENGKFYFLQGAAYLHDVTSELLIFPMATHDDIVDVCSMAADEVTLGNHELRPLDTELSDTILNYTGY